MSAEIIEAAQEAYLAALGDSNDAEIEALQGALELCLSALGIKVPEVEQCWECEEDGNGPTLATESDDNGPLCEGCYNRRVEDGHIEVEEEKLHGRSLPKGGNVATITASTGIRWNVRILRKGDNYGLHLEWTHDEPGVEFYDARYPHTEYGQFVSRYYVNTILANRENGDRESAYGGLDLQTDIADWKIDAPAMFVLRQWLHQETGEIGG